MSFREDQSDRLNAALEKADVALRSKIEELSFVIRVGEAISRHTSSRELSAELVEIVAETILCNYAVLYRRAPDGQYALHAASQVFGDGNFPNSFDLSLLREDLTGRAQSFGIHDLSNLKTTEEWPFPLELRSWLFVPLKVCETAGAILILADAEASAISPQMQRTLMMVTPQISSALSNIELYADLRASETKYRTFVEGMQDAVYICTPDLRIVESNPAAQALSALASPHRCLKDLFTSEEAAREFEKAIRISGRVQDFEADFFASAGKPVVGSVSAVADPQRVSVIIRDIRTEATVQTTGPNPEDGVDRNPCQRDRARLQQRTRDHSAHSRNAPTTRRTGQTRATSRSHRRCFQAGNQTDEAVAGNGAR